MSFPRAIIRNVFASLASAVLFSAAAVAQASDQFANTLQNIRSGIDSLWPAEMRIEGVTTRLGLGFAIVPDYRGSDNYRLRLAPLVDIRFEDRLRLFNNRLSFAAIKKKHFEAGPQLIYNFGRNESANKVLEGIGDTKNAFMGGLYARYRSDNALLGIDFRQALEQRQGWWLEAVAGHGIYKNGKFSMGVGVRAKYRSKRSMQTVFGITDAQSSGSVFSIPVFSANSGISEVNLNALGIYSVSENVRFLGLFTYGRLFSDARRSPLVKDRGSANQITTGVGLFFQF